MDSASIANLSLALPPRQSSEAMTKNVLAAVNENYDILRATTLGLLGPNFPIDEMAVCIPDKDALVAFLTNAVRTEGYELFNSAKDVVQVEPIRAAYEVEYWFLRTPYAYRIEVMRMGRGYSPLHSSVTSYDEQSPESRGAIYGIHASFKCKTEEAYAVANSMLGRSEWEQVQRSQSTYGKFNYYASSNPEQTWFLKPRMNLRDQPEGEQTNG